MASRASPVKRPTIEKATTATPLTKAKDGAVAAAGAASAVVEKGTGKTKVAAQPPKFVDPKVAARNSALNAMGGVKGGGIRVVASGWLTRLVAFPDQWTCFCACARACASRPTTRRC
jgi:hypothetical protein